MAQNNTLNINELMNRKNPPVIKAGKYENVTIKSYEVMTSNNNQFVRFTFKLEDGREISDNRFAQGLGIMISHLREQLDLQDIEISGTELFEKCKTQKFKIWVEKAVILNANTGLSQRVTNIHFLEPLNMVVNDNQASNAQPTEEQPTSTPVIKNDEMPE